MNNALESQDLKRIFRFKKEGKFIDLQDPNPDFSNQEVIQIYTRQYPELAVATVSQLPKFEDNLAVYEIKTTVGTKG